MVLLGVTPCAFAQFSISKVTPEQVEIKVTEDSSKKKIVNLDNNFYSRARYKAERRAIRQERNTLQINASAMFNQTGFTNWSSSGKLCCTKSFLKKPCLCAGYQVGYQA